MEACLAESLEIVQGLDRKRDFKSEFKANLKELKSTRKFKKNKKEQLEKLKGKSQNIRLFCKDHKCLDFEKKNTVWIKSTQIK